MAMRISYLVKRLSGCGLILVAGHLALVTPVSAAAGDAAPLSAGPAAEERQAAPPTRATTLDGRTVDLADLTGRVVILDFWATWCPPCRAEIPHFKALYARHAPRLEILGVAMDQDGRQTVSDFVTQQGIPYPVAMGDDGALANAYGGVRGLPTTFVMDPAGRLYKKYVGYQAESVFEQDITALLNP